jgi:DNA primase
VSVVDDIKARLDIVDVVSGYVSLQKAGRSFKAVCPFHTEKTPSFIVNPERQSWHCFGACATGGDAFSYVMKAENLDFGDALRMLAQKTGIELAPVNRQESDRRDTLHKVNQLAARFYQDMLASPQGRNAMKYLEERGVSAGAIEKFQLGLSPDGRDGLKSYLLNMGVSENDAGASGLIYRREDGKTWDFFRGRLMFPISDRQGRVAGFGARSLDGSNPKYINTSATPIFDKRSTLYALHLAHESIRSKNTGVVVEGYMDVIAAHQHGYSNVVASMGTALTEDQVLQLKSLATNFVLALDPDTAGQEATLRSLEASWKVIGQQTGRSRSAGALYQRDPLVLKIAALPDGRDPDELIRHDSGEWERLTENAVPLMEYLIPAIASRFDISTGQGKSQVVETVFPLIAAAENVFDQDRYLNRLAETLGVSTEALKASLPRPGRRSFRRQEQGRTKQTPEIAASALTSNPEAVIEDYILALLLSRPELKESAAGFSPEHFHKSEDRELFTRWLTCNTIDDLRGSLDESLHPHLKYLTEKELASTDRYESEKALNQCLQRLERRHLQELQEVLLVSEDRSIPPPRELEGEIATVNARIRELFAQPNR